MKRELEDEVLPKNIPELKNDANNRQEESNPIFGEMVNEIENRRSRIRLQAHDNGIVVFPRLTDCNFIKIGWARRLFPFHGRA